MVLQPTFGQRFDSTSRRRFLTGCGTVVLAGAAGCTGFANGIAGLILDDVNLFNETDGVLAGTVSIVDPADETVLREQFEIPPEADDEESEEEDDEDNLTVFKDVWTESGSYNITVELGEDSEIQGESGTTESVSIEETDEEMLAIVLGGEESEDAIRFVVGESLSEFAES